MENYNIGRSGNINDINGLEIYFYNTKKISTIKLYNFDHLEYLQKNIYDILSDNIDLNSQNCIISFGLYVDENFRKLGLSSKIMELAFEECRKHNVTYWLGYRYNNNLISKQIFEKLGMKIIANDEKIEVVVKKL
jgi:GNAT superfamily N-acetyltransferase